LISVDIIRTDEARFDGLPDFPFQPHYHQITSDLRLHYVDEGPKDAPVVLMMHGEPTWCYLYRHMIPPVAEAGARVVAPDLIGFGKSDKFTSQSVYSYGRQVEWLKHWVEALDLNNITLVCQDWGSLIGLRLLTAMPERFSGTILSNGGLPEGGGARRAFRIWKAFSKWSPVFPISKIVQAGTKRRLSAFERAAYDAPFPSKHSKAAARIYPSLVPMENDDPAIPDQKAAWKVLERYDKPFLCCFSDGDPITRGGDRLFIGRVPGTAGQPHTTLKGGHFVQEDDPQGFVAQILKLIGK
jgi:haloalkane dehalogenase